MVLRVQVIFLHFLQYVRTWHEHDIFGRKIWESWFEQIQIDENLPIVFQELGRTMQLLCWYSLKNPASLSLITYSPTGGDVRESCLNLFIFLREKKSLLL